MPCLEGAATIRLQGGRGGSESPDRMVLKEKLYVSGFVFKFLVFKWRHIFQCEKPSERCKLLLGEAR